MRVKGKREAQFVRKRNRVLKGRRKKTQQGWGEQIAVKLQFVTALT